MMDINTSLLNDLGRLARKYEPRDWQNLIDALTSDSRRAELVMLLEELHAASANSRPTKSNRQSGRTQHLRELLTRLRESEPDRAEFLEDFWLKLRTKELLADMTSMRKFAQAVGLKHFDAKRREQGAVLITTYLAELQAPDFDAALSEVGAHTEAQPEDYRRWVHLILGNDASDAMTNEDQSVPYGEGSSRGTEEV
jgi:hypothetical protein